MKTFRNILVIRNDRFGEFLLNIPALRALKETYPDAQLTLAVSRKVAELAKMVKYADKVVVWDAKCFRCGRWYYQYDQ